MPRRPVQVAWKVIYDASDPSAEPLPEPWDARLSRVQKLLVLRVLRPDKLVSAVQRFVLAEMGSAYVEPPPFDLDKCGPLLVYFLSSPP